jgi:hypothetical protein
MFFRATAPFVTWELSTDSLVGISESAHARHDTENIVVRRVDTDRRARGRANRVVGDREEERRVINTRQVA